MLLLDGAAQPVGKHLPSLTRKRTPNDSETSKTPKSGTCHKIELFWKAKVRVREKLQLIPRNEEIK